MRLDWAILSNSAEVRENLSYVLGGGWDTGWRPQFPAPFAAALTLRLLFNRIEFARPHRLELHFLDQDGETFFDPLDIPVSPGVAPDDIPTGWDIPALFAVALYEVRVPRAGLYALHILFDDQHIKTIPFRFIEGAPPTKAPIAPKPERG